MPPSRDVSIVLLGKSCAPQLAATLIQHLQVLEQHDHGWALLESEGPVRRPALRQATLALLLRAPTGVDGGELRDLLDEGLHSDERLVQVVVQKGPLHPELDRLPLLDPQGDLDEQAVAVLDALVERARRVPPRRSYRGVPKVVRADVLGIDRKHQWGKITEAAEKHQHLALLVPGAVDEGHDYFRARVHHLWPRRSAHVYELPLPAQQAGFTNEEQLALAIQRALPPGGDAAGVLSRALSVGDLVLLWPVLHAASFDSKVLRDALTRWLPDLLAKAADRGLSQVGYLRVIVNLDWSRIPAWVHRLFPVLPPLLHGVGALKREAQRRGLLREAQQLGATAGRLAVRCLPELEPIPREDVEEHLSHLKDKDFAERARAAIEDAQDSRHMQERLQETAQRLWQRLW